MIGWTALSWIDNALKLHAIADYFWRRCGTKTDVPYWLLRLNEKFKDDVVVHGPYARKPEIIVKGLQEAGSPRYSKRPSEKDLPNDPHARIMGGIAWEADPLKVSIEVTKYAEVCGLRDKEGTPPPLILSANAVVVSAGGYVVLHRRSNDPDWAATFPGELHTIGGAYTPPGLDCGFDDKYDLCLTVEREVYEETRVHINIGAGVRVIALEELKTGFVQLAFLGVTIPRVQESNLRGNKEGFPVIVEFSQLEQRLVEPGWVPTGKAAVLAWLALGAPGGGWRPQFGGRNPADIFNSVVT